MPEVLQTRTAVCHLGRLTEFCHNGLYYHRTPKQIILMNKCLASEDVIINSLSSI